MPGADTGRGLLAGLGIAFIGIVADRLISAWAESGGRALAGLVTRRLAPRNRARRVAAPLAPTARKQGTGPQPRDLHGQDIRYGADAGAAVVDHGGSAALAKQCLQFGAEYLGRLE